MESIKTWGIFIIGVSVEALVATLYTYEALSSVDFPILNNLAFFYLLILYIYASIIIIGYISKDKDYDLRTTLNEALWKIKQRRQTTGGKFRRIIGNLTDIAIVVSVALTSPIKAALLGIFLAYVTVTINLAIRESTETLK